MKSEKPYLIPDLTLADLSQRLKIPRTPLSALINKGFQKNFNDFVNSYRVEEVKKAMRDPTLQHLSLLGIALECGFNSKSTFNRAFRKATGQAPSDFRMIP